MNCSEILNKMLEHLGMSVREFGQSLGYERVDNFYNVQKGKSDFQYEVLQRIVKKYPVFNPEWLLGNSETMLRPDKNQTSLPFAEDSSFIFTIQILERELKEKDKRIEELEKE